MFDFNYNIDKNLIEFLKDELIVKQKEIFI